MKPYDNLDDITRTANRLSFSPASCGSCRQIHTGSCPIPNAPYYVLSNDRFFSHSPFAPNQINVCVVPCNSMTEARAIERYIRSREDQKYIRIVEHKPRARGRILTLLLSWRYNALNQDEPR
jgi:hypothetical protein